MNAIRNSIAKREYAREAKVLERSVLCRLSPVSCRLLVEAESQARALDDNHVGTEHIMLAIYALGARAATKALESLGVIRESKRWEAAGISGPHHLRDAVEAAGTTLTTIEQKLVQEMSSDHDNAA